MNLKNKIIIIFFIIFTQLSIKIEDCQKDPLKIIEIEKEKKHYKFVKIQKNNRFFILNKKVLKIFVVNNNNEEQLKLFKNEIKNLNLFKENYDFFNYENCFYHEKEEMNQKLFYLEIKPVVSDTNLFLTILNKSIKTKSSIWKFDIIYKIIQIVKKIHIQNLAHLQIQSENIFFLNKFTPILEEFQYASRESKYQIISFYRPTIYDSPEIASLYKKNNIPIFAPVKNYGISLTHSFLFKDFKGSKQIKKTFPITQKSDIYSLGIVMWEMLRNNIARENTEIDFSLQNDIPQDFKLFQNLIEKMTYEDPDQRPNIIELELEFLNILSDLITREKCNKGFNLLYNSFVNILNQTECFNIKFNDYLVDELAFYQKMADGKLKENLIESLEKREMVYRNVSKEIKADIFII